MTRYACVIFDLDGVLIDSRANMEVAWRAVCARCGYDHPFESYFQKIGLPFRDILRRMGITERLNEAEAEFARASIARFDLIAVYEGVVSALMRLRHEGVMLGIVTSKDATRTALAVDKIGVPFDTVQAPAPALKGKPAPDQLLSAVEIVGVSPDAAIYVGDMPVDALTAANAGMGFAHAGWGYGPPSAGAKVCAPSPRALVDFIMGSPRERDKARDRRIAR